MSLSGHYPRDPYVWMLAFACFVFGGWGGGGGGGGGGWLVDSTDWGGGEGAGEGAGGEGGKTMT